MLGYYLKLALRSCKRNKVLTALMVLALALGIGAAMTTLTVYNALSGDPIPAKSERLFHVQLDSGMLGDYQAGQEPRRQLMRLDAEQLLRQQRGNRQALMTGGMAVVETDHPDHKPMQLETRWASADFFAMFNTPFLYGHGWSADDDDAHARVVVIGRELNAKLFAGSNSVGKQLLVEGHAMRIVGVLDHWSPQPHFYDLNIGSYGGEEQLYAPFATAIEFKFGVNSAIDCFGNQSITDFQALSAPCAWLQYWVELDSSTQADDYLAYLHNYSQQQYAAGRYQRPPNPRLRNVMQWLQHNQVVPSDVRMQLWLALGFLLICLVNTVGLMLAKFLRRSGELGVRRALGATRGTLFAQCLVEAGSIGAAGAVLGLGFTLLGLWAVRQRPTEYAALARLDGSMLLLCLLLAVLASILAGLLPAWRATRLAPALQVKIQ